MKTAPFLLQTLGRTTAAKSRAVCRLSTLPESSWRAELASEADAKAVEKIEDVIHSFIVKRSRPDWLPFVPGASYWVPPRRTSYGVAEMVQKLANALTDEEHLSLTTLQGWPSSAFYIYNDASSHLDLAGNKAPSTKASLHEEEAEEV